MPKITIESILPLLEREKQLIFTCALCCADLEVKFYKNGLGDLVIDVEQCNHCTITAHNEGYQFGKDDGVREGITKGYQKRIDEEREKTNEGKKKTLFNSRNRKLDLKE